MKDLQDQLILFIHGIGPGLSSPEDKEELQTRLQPLTDRGAIIVPIDYDHVLRSKAPTRLVTLAARAASSTYLGTPVVGGQVSEYMTDIFQFLLSYKTQVDVVNTVRSQIRKQLLNNTLGSKRTVTVAGHSLGALVSRLLRYQGNMNRDIDAFVDLAGAYNPDAMLIRKLIHKRIHRFIKKNETTRMHTQHWFTNVFPRWDIVSGYDKTTPNNLTIEGGLTGHVSLLPMFEEYFEKREIGFV